MDGENSHMQDLAGMLMPTPVQIRFDAKTNPVTLAVDVTDARMDFVLSDALQSRELLLVFAAKSALVGKTDRPVRMFAEQDAARSVVDGADVFADFMGLDFAKKKDSKK